MLFAWGRSRHSPLRLLKLPSECTNVRTLRQRRLPRAPTHPLLCVCACVRPYAGDAVSGASTEGGAPQEQQDGGPARPPIHLAIKVAGIQ